MSYFEFALVIVASSIAAVIFIRFVHRRVHVELRRRHQDVGSMVFLQLGVLFAVLLAFVFSEAFTEYEAAQRAIDLECGALHGAAIIESTLPAPVARHMLALEAAYITAVVEHDWPEMRAHHRGSSQGVEAITSLIQSAARLAAQEPALSPTATGQILTLYATAHAQREVRLFEAQNGLPPVLWVALICYGMILMGFVAFCGVDNLIWLTALGLTFAVCVSMTMAVVGLLNYPFDGALALKPADFLLRLADVNSLMLTVQ